jgi:hypothetical protein
MTDAELVKATQARLTELSQRALQMHRTQKTREYILKTHNRWQYELATVELTHDAISPDTRKAFGELDAMMAILIEERGEDPDSILHWLDMYPAIVIGVHLRVPQAHLA